MPTYIIGDIQGCYDQLMRLLDKINLDESTDRLWFTGDLVCRGPKSLESLRAIYDLRHVSEVVLGNHDLTLLSYYFMGQPVNEDTPTLYAIKNTYDGEKLIEWLRTCPLMILDGDAAMVHAGIYPLWTVETAYSFSKEVSLKLQTQEMMNVLRTMYGNTPQSWETSHVGWERTRFIINAFTRMRYVSCDGILDLSEKEKTHPQPDIFKPWFELRREEPYEIYFGHWASLRGECSKPHIYALDTGCVWQGSLTAMRREDKALFSVPCS